MLNEREIELIRETARTVVEDHTCPFSEQKLRHLNAFLDAVETEGADHETHIYVLRIGNNFKNIVKKSGQYLVWVFLLASVIVATQLLGLKINPIKWIR